MQKKFSLKEAKQAKNSIIRSYFKPDTEKTVENVNNLEQDTERLFPPLEEKYDVIKVSKVFQECRLVDTNEIFHEPTAPLGAVDVEYLGSKLIEPPASLINLTDQTVTAVFSFVTAYQFIDENGDVVGDVQIIKVLDERKTAVLSRAGELGLDCQADVFLECIKCFVSKTGPNGEILEVTCWIGKQILFELIAEVQLLAKTLGYVPEPVNCEPAGGVDIDFSPVWPPYPPRSSDFPPKPKE